MRALNPVIAIGVPVVPVVTTWRIGNLVLSFVAGATNRDQFAALQVRAALRRGDVGAAAPHNDSCFLWRDHFDAVAAAVTAGTNRNIRSVDFSIGFAVLEDRITRLSLAELNLNLVARKVNDVGLRVLIETENICVVEFEFGT